MHAYGVKNPIHAGDIIAQSKATVLTFNCCLTYNKAFVSFTGRTLSSAIVL